MIDRESFRDIANWPEGVVIDGATLIIADVLIRDPKVLNFESRLKKCNVISGRRIVSSDEFSAIKKTVTQAGDVNKETTTISDAIKLFREAADAKASDIHIRVNDGFAEILLRVDGDLRYHDKFLSSYAKSLCATIYGAMTDISDPIYQPGSYQDARIASFKMLPMGVHGIRISSGPQANGSFMVLRLLYDDTMDVSGVESLGYTEDHVNLIDSMKHNPTGINIIAGPTGSGKSTTLKHVLEILHLEYPGKNIITVEDPPEYTIRGAVQVPVTNADNSEKRSEAFAKAIRSAMRSDPDIIMIGEIRDMASAKLAVRAAMTGHQVWTTLHANSAFNIINRMVDIMSGPDQGNPLAVLCDVTVLTGLIFQRLAKRLCPKCKILLTEQKPKDLRQINALKRLSNFIDIDSFPDIAFKGEGCLHCKNTGITRRTVLAEVCALNEDLLDVIRKNGVEDGRKLWLSDKKMKGKSVIYHAIEKIKEGIVAPDMAEEAVGPLRIG